ncbi:MAG: hypothetical protein ABR541_00100 [Candidatus Dormibacteria bacterium]
MKSSLVELELPLGEPAPPARTDLGEQRLEQLRVALGSASVPDALLRHFGSLRELYAAPPEQIERLVGAVHAARLAWFLDAPFRPASLALFNRGRGRAA